MSHTTLIHRIRADESGFGIVEVLIASVLLAVGILATMTALDGATRGSYSAQRNEQAISLAQREIEEIAAVPFDRIELDALPGNVAASDPNNPSDPRAYVSGSNFMIKRNYHDSSAGPPTDTASSEPMIVDPDADPAADGYSIPAVTQNVPVGAVGANGAQQEATIWRFVTRRDENCEILGVGLLDLCPAEQGARRVTVAVALEQPAAGTGGPQKPTYVTTVVTDPDVAPLDLPLDVLGL